MKVTKEDLSIIYYTSNELEKKNPYFVENTKKQLIKAIDDLPLIIVSQQPTLFDDAINRFDQHNIVVGDIGRSHLNIYKQMLIGAKAAKTKFVATAEDDIFYSYQHFHSELPKKRVFLYDMNKWSIFTWIKPAQYTYRDRMVINQLIVERELLIEALEERFARVTELLKTQPLDNIIKYWGDFSRYESLLGVTVRPAKHFFSSVPSLVFTHIDAFGYLNHGSKKRLGNPRAFDIPVWREAKNIMKLYDKNYEEN